jgi:hypothetical protein
MSHFKCNCVNKCNCHCFFKRECNCIDKSICECIFSNSVTAEGIATTSNGYTVTSTASASASSTKSFEDAWLTAYEIAKINADIVANHDSNLIDETLTIINQELIKGVAEDKSLCPDTSSADIKNIQDNGIKSLITLKSLTKHSRHIIIEEIFQIIKKELIQGVKENSFLTEDEKNKDVQNITQNGLKSILSLISLTNNTTSHNNINSKIDKLVFKSPSQLPINFTHITSSSYDISSSPNGNFVVETDSVLYLPLSTNLKDGFVLNCINRSGQEITINSIDSSLMYNYFIAINGTQSLIIPVNASLNLVFVVNYTTNTYYWHTNFC